MYYGLILFAVILFTGCSVINDTYRKQQGSSLKVSMQFTLISSITGLMALLCINGLKLEFTFFTLCMALLTCLVSFGCTFCTFKALESINLSLYSVFCMLGGMVLPFIQGIWFYGEAVTGTKIVCFVLLCIALGITVEKGKKRTGTKYYIGIFVLNGMMGVLSKIFSEAPFHKTSAAGYSILIAFCGICIAAAALLTVLKKEEVKPVAPGFAGLASAAGIANKIANFILVIALAHVDSSVQYPMVTGGVMIASTTICFFGENKPSKKEVLSVLIAFVAMLVLLI